MPVQFIYCPGITLSDEEQPMRPHAYPPFWTRIGSSLVAGCAVPNRVIRAPADRRDRARPGVPGQLASGRERKRAVLCAWQGRADRPT